MPLVKKQRQDKYYYLAKEKGYRARSAFKLLELNQKYDFLRNAKIAVDLCAAPGGWSQILMQEMPVSRKIIAIDLDRINKLGDVISFQSDITSVDCRRELVSLLDNQKVDIFVHDGAPKFGYDAGQDRYIQNTLVLHAAKLATEFLGEKGVFVTKIHRSENFTKIIELFQLLFDQVNVTKPLSSKDESAEIFAVCRDFKHEIEIDPKLFDPEYLFVTEDVDVDQYKSILLSDLIISKEPLSLIKNSGNIRVDFEHNSIDSELLECFKDLKVLGMSDIRNIMKFKRKIVKEIKSNKFTTENILIKQKFDEIYNVTKHDEESEEEDFMKNLEEEINKIERSRKKSFYNDKVFNMEKHYGTFDCKNEFENITRNLDYVEDKKIINEDSSCSEDFDLNSDELECLAMLKEDPEEFKQATVDKHLIDSDDNLLPGEERGVKKKMIKERKPISKKELEALGRKRLRALRRSEKKLKGIEIEDEQEEAVLYKKIFKNQLRKQNQRRKLVFANIRGGTKRLPKGQGRCLRLDRRMKHDLYIAKHRKVHKRKRT